MKHKLAILVFSAVFMNIISCILIKNKMSYVEFCQKDYLIVTSLYYYKFTVLPSVIILNLNVAKQELNINRVIRYGSMKKVYGHIIAQMLWSSVIAAVITIISIMLVSACICRLPADNWKVEKSYAFYKYGVNVVEYQYYKLIIAEVFSYVYTAYILSCVSVLVMRISKRSIISCCIVVLIIVMEYGKFPQKLLLYYGIIYNSVYIVSFNLGHMMIVCGCISLMASIVIDIMGHGDFLE